MKALSTLYAFNRGLVSRLSLARTDLKRMALSAETQTNWIPRTLGSMMLRPGLNKLGSTYTNSPAVFLPFIFSVEDTAVLELTGFGMRVWINDLLLHRFNGATPPVITNGAFTTDLSGWNDADEGAAVSSWDAGYMSLTGTGTQEAIRWQMLTKTVSGNDSYSISVKQGAARFKIGNAVGSGNFFDGVLAEGFHSIRGTNLPEGIPYYIQFSNLSTATALIDYIVPESEGDMLVPTPWSPESLLDLRYESSGDVIFCAHSFYPPYRIERRGAYSWSVVRYLPQDGPFLLENITSTTLTPSALSGTVTITASRAVFTGGEVDGLLKLSSKGQTVTTTITAADRFSDPIRVTGVGVGRNITVTMSGADVGTATLQRSVGAPGAWSDAASYPTVVSNTYNDGLDNQVMYYRFGVKTGDYVSGTVTLTLAHAVGSITGVARVKSFLSPTQVVAVVLKSFGSTAATEYWSEGAWSPKSGYPSAVALFEGRLWWAGNDRYDGSVPDAYDSFDETIEGDSGPISGKIGIGPVDSFKWIAAGTNLVLGGGGAEYLIRGSYLDEPLTPTNFGLKTLSSLGSASVAPVKLDNSLILVQRNAERVYEIPFVGGGENPVPKDLTFIAVEACSPGVTRMAVQRQPDTRLHCVRRDGKVAILLFDKEEEITAWVLFETDGIVEDVVVLPGYETPSAAADAEHSIQLPGNSGWIRAGVVEDTVYYLVKRTINGVDKRYLEKWEREAAAQGGLFCAALDSFRRFESTIPFTVIQANDGNDVLGLTHLEGKTVAVWGNGKDLGTYVVTGGSITLSEPVTLAYVGLVYTAKFKSTKLAVGSQPLTQRKRIDHVGLILADTHARGLKYGVDFDNLDDMPGTEGYAEIGADSIYKEYDEDSIELNGAWDTDTRLCLQAQSPRPCTILAAVISVAEHDKK